MITATLITSSLSLLILLTMLGVGVVTWLRGQRASNDAVNNEIRAALLAAIQKQAANQQQAEGNSP